MEQVRVLGDVSDGVAQARLFQPPHVGAADTHRPVLDLVEARHQVGDGGLARP